MQTFTPIEYLKIDVAGSYGHDKLSWTDRIAWFDANEAAILNAADNSKEPLLREAEAPALFFAGANAYKEALEGKAIGYPISLDATASGAQLLAILKGCPLSAEMCNVISTGYREDLYTSIYEIMLIQSGKDSKLTRQDVKDAVMPAFYGSEKRPKEVFGEGEMLDLFEKTMSENAPGIWELNKQLLHLWNPTTLSHDWILPDNYHVHVKVMGEAEHNFLFMDIPGVAKCKINEPQAEGRSLSANVVHSVDGMVVREMTARCDYDLKHITELKELIYKKEIFKTSTSRKKDEMVQILWGHYVDSGFLSVRILDYLDERNLGLVDYSVVLKLLKTLPEKPFHLLSVHDCFRVHPNYGNDLRQTYVQILHELAASTLMQFIISQLVGRIVPFHKGALDPADVLKAEYALS